MAQPISRFLEQIAFADTFGRQMRFIAGPRQAGKTTIARHKLGISHSPEFYYNWDKKIVRDRYRKEPDFLGADILKIPAAKKAWVCFDEIHKIPKWKNILKDFFDSYEEKCRFIVTGSARLDLFRKSGDSLAGRYFLFRLNPLMLSEISGKRFKSVLPEKSAEKYIEKALSHGKFEQEALDNILNLSAFPEPFTKTNALFANKWHSDYLERIIKEDLRDISAIHQLEKVMDLAYLLPKRIGAPLSINSLRKDLELNFNTVKNYIRYLMLTYALFEVPPYDKKIKRLVKKERKVYFFDIALVEDEANRFENYVACELKARIDLWNDATTDKYSLSFVKTRDGKETDFLILKNKVPFLLCEAKLSEGKIANHHHLHSDVLGKIPYIQILKKNNILLKAKKNFYVASASRFFS